MNLETLYSTINPIQNGVTTLLYAFSNGNLVAFTTDNQLYFSTNLGQSWTSLGCNGVNIIYECNDYILIATNDLLGQYSWQKGVTKITSTGQVLRVNGAPPYTVSGYMYDNKMVISSYRGGGSSGPPASGEGLYLYSYNNETNSLTWLQTFEENNYQRRTWELVGVYDISTGPFSLPQPVAFFYKTGIGEGSYVYSISFDLLGNANFNIHSVTIPNGNWDHVKESLVAGDSTVYFFSRYHQWELPFSDVNSSEALYYKTGYYSGSGDSGAQIVDVFYDSRIERGIVAIILEPGYYNYYYFAELLSSLPGARISYKAICNLFNTGRPVTNLKQVKFPNGNIFYCKEGAQSGESCISVGNTDSDLSGTYIIQNNNLFFPIRYGNENVKQQIYALTSNLTVPSELTVRIGNTNKKLLKWNVQQQFIDRTITYISYNGFPRPEAFINKNGQKNLLYRADLNINKRNRLLTQDGPTMYMDS